MADRLLDRFGRAAASELHFFAPADPAALAAARASLSGVQIARQGPGQRPGLGPGQGEKGQSGERNTGGDGPVVGEIEKVGGIALIAIFDAA